MAIYPDKKNGALTGRFRVELQQQGHPRYRKRFDTIKAAKEAEDAVLASWGRGEDAPGTTSPVQAVKGHTIQSVAKLATGQLWDGMAIEAANWAHIRIIGDILGQDTLLDDITTIQVDEVVKGLQKLKKSDATINRYLSNLKTLLGWAADPGRGYRTVPVAAVKFTWRKEKPGRIRWITEDEEQALEKHLPKDIWMVVKIAIETGCRREELLSVEASQINGNRLHLWDTKTDSPRTVPMGPETTRMLKELVAGKRMPTWSALRYWWAHAKKAMGLEDDKNFVFHTTRHTRATRMLDKGINPLIIKEWLGHKRIETTQRYTHVKPQNLESALETVGGF